MCRKTKKKGRIRGENCDDYLQELLGFSRSVVKSKI